MKKNMLRIFGLVTIGFAISGSSQRSNIPEFLNIPLGGEDTASISPLRQVKADWDFGRMPLAFIPNRGQTDSRVAYYVQGKDKTLYFTAEGITLVLTKSEEIEEHTSKSASTGSIQEFLDRALKEKSPGPERWAVKLNFVGAKRVMPVGEGETGALVSYFKGMPEDWKTGLPIYSKLIYKDLWPRIDLVYKGTWNRLKYEFIVHPGADPAHIRLGYEGITGLRIDGAGALEVKTPLGDWRDDVPVAYQEVDGKRHQVPIGYQISEPEEQGSGEFGFEVGPYDQTKLLILDPAVLIYCGYIGGLDNDYAYDVAVDSAGCAYVAGYTDSTPDNFPVKSGPDLTFNGEWDAFVAKVNFSGSGLVYCGYIGGNAADAAYGIAVDGSGCAYVTGYTDSTEDTFPRKIGPDLVHNGFHDAFVAKVNSSGTGLVYCGYIGGSNDEYGLDIAVDSGSNAYVAGYTLSMQSSFPVKTGPDLTHNGLEDGFVARVNSSGESLAFCGYLGGSNTDIVNGIAVDGSGSAYVAGETLSSQTSFPEKTGPDLTHNGSTDAFVAKVSDGGESLVYCGYIGGSSTDKANGIAVDGSGSAYVAGETFSSQATFPEKVGPDLTYNSAKDAFVAKVNSSGSGLIYCGYIGGSGADDARGIAVDSFGNALIVGTTASTQATFPEAVGPDLTHNGGNDAFVAGVNSSGTALVFCGYIGGTADDLGYGIAASAGGDAFIAGRTESTEATFPVKSGPDLSYNGGAYDAFVAKIVSSGKDDLLGTWSGQGIFRRNSDSGAWVKLASPGVMIAAGDLDGDAIDDLIGVWPAQDGVWIKYSKTGKWSKLAATADWIGAGDMNGDGRCDLLGTWAGQGVFYRNSVSGAWVKVASPALQVAAGDLDGDNKDDLIGIWPSQSGVWVKYSKTSAWSKLSSTADWIAVGDMNGDGRCDLLGTWAGQGVFYRDSVSSVWVKMASPASQVGAGDLNGDAAGDLLGIWLSAGGVYVKYSTTNLWLYLSSAADWIAAGRMRAVGAGGNLELELSSPEGGWTLGPDISEGEHENLLEAGPRGIAFQAEEEINTVVGLVIDESRQPGPGPGEPGFTCLVENNLVPHAAGKKKAAGPKLSRSRGDIH